MTSDFDSSHLDLRLQNVPSESGWVVALSGGRDSCLLLDRACAVARSRAIPLKAIHVHHGLSEHADVWAEFCQQLCQSYRVDFILKKVKVDTEGNLESAARRVRYEAFEQSLQEGELLLLAHHARDQAETFLMRSTRGTSLFGLASIPQQRPLGQGRIVRPWLTISHTKIKDAVAHLKLSHIEDESNLDVRFDRNYLRHCVLPHLSKKWPDAEQRIGETIQRLSSVQDLMNEYIAEDFSRVSVSDDRYHSLVDIEVLKSFSRTKQELVIQFWVHSLGVQGLSQNNLNRLLDEVVPASEGSSARIAWSGWEARIYQGRLYVFPSAALKDTILDTVPLKGALHRDAICMGHTQVTIKSCDAEEAHLSLTEEDLAQTSIRCYRQGDELLEAFYRSKSLIKKIYKQCRIPGWERRIHPVFVVDDKIVLVHPSEPKHLRQKRASACHHFSISYRAVRAF